MHPCLTNEPISWEWVGTGWISEFQETLVEVTRTIGRQGQSIYKQGLCPFLGLLITTDTLLWSVEIFVLFSQLPHPEISEIEHNLWNFNEEIVICVVCAERLDICFPLLKWAGYTLYCNWVLLLKTFITECTREARIHKWVMCFIRWCRHYLELPELWMEAISLVGRGGESREGGKKKSK